MTLMTLMTLMALLAVIQISRAPLARKTYAKYALAAYQQAWLTVARSTFGVFFNFGHVPSLFKLGAISRQAEASANCRKEACMRSAPSESLR